jgi:hypothetical protein
VDFNSEDGNRNLLKGRTFGSLYALRIIEQLKHIGLNVGCYKGLYHYLECL